MVNDEQERNVPFTIPTSHPIIAAKTSRFDYG